MTKTCSRSSKLKKQIFHSFVWQMTEMIVYQNWCRFIFLRWSRRCSSDMKDTREKMWHQSQRQFADFFLLCADRKLWFGFTCDCSWLGCLSRLFSNCKNSHSSHCDALVDGKRLHSVTDQSLAELNQTDFHWCHRSSWLIMTPNISTF